MFGPDLIGDSVGLSDVLEADAKQIATVARETFEKYALNFCSTFLSNFI